MLSRAQFMELTGLKTDDVTALKRRDQMPFFNEEDGYDLFGALTLQLASRMVSANNGLSVSWRSAVEIVRDAGRDLAERGPEIAESAKVFRLVPGATVFFVGRINIGFAAAQQHGAGGRMPFVGSTTELADVLADVDPLDVLVTNVTATVAVLQHRALRMGIDVSMMWPAAASIPAFQQRHEAKMAGLRANIDKMIG